MDLEVSISQYYTQSTDSRKCSTSGVYKHTEKERPLRANTGKRCDSSRTHLVSDTVAQENCSGKVYQRISVRHLEI